MGQLEPKSKRSASRFMAGLRLEKCRWSENLRLNRLTFERERPNYALRQRSS
jgi:hypothetical protein